MLEISKWTSSASALLLIVSVSVLIGLRLFGSPAAKNRIICYHCDKTDPNCEEKAKCQLEHQVCAQVLKNGEFIFKGCSPETKSFQGAATAVCPRNDADEARARGGSSPSATCNTIEDEWHKVIDDFDSNLQPGDRFKMLFCGTDECNTKEQLQRSENNSSSLHQFINSALNESATYSGKYFESGSGSGSGSGYGNNSEGKSSPSGSRSLRWFEMALEVIEKVLLEGKIKRAGVIITGRESHDPDLD